MGASSGSQLTWNNVANTHGFGDLTRPAFRFFSGHCYGDCKTDVLINCPTDGNSYVGASSGNQLTWNNVANTHGFGDLTRPAIRFFTGDFNGDGKTDVLFYDGTSVV